jgi:hypothetical protein
VNGNIKIPAGAMEIFDQLFGALVHDLGDAGFAIGKLVAVVYKAEFTNILVPYRRSSAGR